MCFMSPNFALRGRSSKTPTRRSVLSSIGGAGAVALAGCLGGDGSSEDGETSSTDSRGTTPTTAAASATGCDALTAGGYRRYDAAGKPIFFTFDRPGDWRIAVENPGSNGYLVNFERTFEVAGETTSAILGITLSNSPSDDVGFDSFVELGWEERTVSFDGNDHQFVLSPIRSPSRWNITGALTYGTGADRPYYAVGISMTASDDGNCHDQFQAIRDRLIGSIVPNEDTTFAPREE